MREEFIQHTQSQEPSTENLFRVLGWHGHETTESALRRMVLSLELSCTLSLLFWRYPLTNHGIHIYYITHNSHSSSSSYRKGSRMGGRGRRTGRVLSQPECIQSRRRGNASEVLSNMTIFISLPYSYLQWEMVTGWRARLPFFPSQRQRDERR